MIAVEWKKEGGREKRKTETLADLASRYYRKGLVPEMGV
jgi:hypothetical protein